jgi:hypothetical protein
MLFDKVDANLMFVLARSHELARLLSEADISLAACRRSHQTEPPRDGVFLSLFGTDARLSFPVSASSADGKYAAAFFPPTFSEMAPPDLAPRRQ